MTKHGYRIGLLLTLALAVLAAPLLAQEKDTMTAPPWGDAGARIHFGDEDQGVLQIQYKGQFRMNVRDIGSGLNNDDTTTNSGFRRNRIAFMGAWSDKVSLYVQTEFAEPNLAPVDFSGAGFNSNFQLLDAVARFSFSDAFKVNVGRFKYNLSRENLEACEEPLTLDRSLFIRTAYVGTRDDGVAVWGNLFSDKVQYRADVMEGRQALPGTIAPASNPRFSGRAHVTLLDPETSYGYKGTYLGKKKVLTFGAAYQFEPKVTYVDPDTQLGKKDYQAWTVDGFFEYPFKGAGTVTASGAYEKVDLNGAYMGANPDNGATGIFGEKNGWYGKAGYLFPGTPLQVFGRYEKWRFACLLNVFDQIVDWYGFGANYYIWGQNLKLTAEWSKTDFDVEGSFTNVQGTTRTTKDFNTFVAQMQFIF
jgi:Phosphate-selective porin O and P